MNTLLLATVTLLLCAGQFLFKRTGVAMQGRSFVEALWGTAVLPSFYLALALYGTATLLWIYVLSRVPLIVAYPWIAAATALIPVIGWFFYGERAGPTFWLGFALILVGLALTQLDAGWR